MYAGQNIDTLHKEVRRLTTITNDLLGDMQEAANDVSTQPLAPRLLLPLATAAARHPRACQAPHLLSAQCLQARVRGPGPGHVLNAMLVVPTRVAASGPGGLTASSPRVAPNLPEHVNQHFTKLVCFTKPFSCPHGVRVGQTTVTTKPVQPLPS